MHRGSQLLRANICGTMLNRTEKHHESAQRHAINCVLTGCVSSFIGYAAGMQDKHTNLARAVPKQVAINIFKSVGTAWKAWHLNILLKVGTHL